MRSLFSVYLTIKFAEVQGQKRIISYFVYDFFAVAL